MPSTSSFDYAVIRVVPRPEREEFLNAGVILYCLARDFLQARIHLDPARLRAFAPDADLAAIADHLAAIPLVCAGGPAAGPIGRLKTQERWHWLVSPRSTQLQISAVHSGLCEDPQAALEKLLTQVVLRPGR